MKTIIPNAHDFLLSDIDLYMPKIGTLANHHSQHLEIEMTLVFLNYTGLYHDQTQKRTNGTGCGMHQLNNPQHYMKMHPT
jgi:hypothetical protein